MAKKNRNVALESVMVQEALSKLPKDHEWTSVRIWFDGDDLLGSAEIGDIHVIYTDGEWITLPI